VVRRFGAGCWLNQASDTNMLEALPLPVTAVNSCHWSRQEVVTTDYRTPTRAHGWHCGWHLPGCAPAAGLCAPCRWFGHGLSAGSSLSMRSRSFACGSPQFALLQATDTHRDHQCPIDVWFSSHFHLTTRRPEQRRPHRHSTSLSSGSADPRIWGSAKMVAKNGVCDTEFVM
jgi:hypothetical protein